jgi:hypothetical protein
VCAEDGCEEQVQEIAVVEKPHQRIEHLGLTLAEAKAVLKRLQQHLVEQQATAFVAAHAQCDHCGTSLGIKEYHTRTFRERYRYGERTSTGFVESTVNQVISKRFCKKQQMQWTKRGAHLLLQTRVKTLNQELGAVFQRWYPDLQLEEAFMAA